MKPEDILLLKDWNDKDVYYGFNETSWDFSLPICNEDEPCDTIPALIGQATPNSYSSSDKIGIQYDVFGRLHITNARYYGPTNNDFRFYSVVIERPELSLPTNVCLDLIKREIKVVLYQYLDHHKKWPNLTPICSNF